MEKISPFFNPFWLECFDVNSKEVKAYSCLDLGGALATAWLLRAEYDCFRILNHRGQIIYTPGELNEAFENISNHIAQTPKPRWKPRIIK